MRKALEASGEVVEERVFRRLARRFKYLQGDFADPDTYARLAKQLQGVSHPLFYLEIPPSLFAPVVAELRPGGSHRACAGDDREAFRARPGVSPSTERVLHETLDEDQILRIDHFLGKQPVLDIHFLRFRQRVAGAGVESRSRRRGADHHGRGLRRGGPRRLLRRGRNATRRGAEPSPPSPRADRHGGSRGKRDLERSGTRRSRSSGRSTTSIPARLRTRPVRRLPQGSSG
jgi:hypothetical protein